LTANDTELLLDTHVWYRHQVTRSVLKPATADAIDEAAERNLVFVSVISIWELAMLERDGKLELVGGVDRWSQEALSKPGISLLPFSPQIAIESVNLPEPMHKDPADRILVASARVERMTLVTSDKAVLSFAKATRLAHLRA
jgi:PIN domain nuclease of toxin-antitoxin system